VGRGSWRGGEENQNPTKHVALGPWAPPHPVRAPPPGIARPFAAHAQYRGPVQALKPLHLEVANESHGRAQDESHFHVLVVAEAFEGIRPLQRHRLVNQLFTDEAGQLKFHSLRITAKTPGAWAEDQTAPAAPKCTGRGDGRGPTDASAL
ncbi:unnamed protein product, partial [Prorocentrum cordatum]